MSTLNISDVWKYKGANQSAETPHTGTAGIAYLASPSGPIVVPAGTGQGTVYTLPPFGIGSPYAIVAVRVTNTLAGRIVVRPNGAEGGAIPLASGGFASWAGCATAAAHAMTSCTIVLGEAQGSTDGVIEVEAFGIPATS